MDRDRCLDMIAEAVDGHRRELNVISRGLHLCESTLCSDVASVRTWVTSAVGEQQRMVLCVMSEMVRLGKVIEGSGRAHGAEGKVVEEGSELSGGHGVQEADASAMKEGDKGKALGKPASPAEAPGVQAGVCEGSCDSAAGAVSGTPDPPRLSTAPDVHVRGGQSLNGCLLHWQPSQRGPRRLPLSRRLSVVHRCIPMLLARFLLCCGSLRPMWMIRLGPMTMGRWSLLVGQLLR